jgi:hypothetical protein
MVSDGFGAPLRNQSLRYAIATGDIGLNLTTTKPLQSFLVASHRDSVTAAERWVKGSSLWGVNMRTR